MSNEIIQEKIKSFLREMSEQDNRSTAAPYFYVIRSSKYVETDGDYEYDKVIFRDNSVDDLTFDSYTKYKEYCEEDGYKPLEEEDLDQIFLKKIWVESNMFLTEKDALSHLEKNHYHYSDDAHTYIKHCFRAPELESFFNNLFEYFDIKPWSK